jgi:O-acetyl-ADP-ribose deacetylase (regulator of RNase III)
MQKTNFGNLLKEVKTGIIIHGCNNHGVMGSGFAKELRALYPEAYNTYRRHYEEQGLKLGEVILHWLNPELAIANAITQDGFGRDGQRYVSYKAVHDCFENMSVLSLHTGLDLHYPLIGAGLGGGDWSIIQSVINSATKGIHQFERCNLWILD